MYYHKRPARMAPTSSQNPNETPLVTFPLPESKIPKVHVSDNDAKSYRRQTYEVVANTLDKESAFRFQENEMLDPQLWKFVKSKDRLRVYKRVTSEEMLVPMVLGIGVVEGTIEDALYGLHHKTTAEMRKMTAFVHENIVDTAVLANIDVGTDEDPFRYMGLKWRVAQTPGGNLIKNRDVCNLESMGIATDVQGIKYGYQVLKSVDVPSFPALPETVVIRAKMMLCTIFRQISPNTVSIYSKGVFDFAGGIPDAIAYGAFADIVMSVSKAFECAVAKRLTLMVLQGDRSAHPLSKLRPTRNLLRPDKDVPRSAACSVCLRGPSVLSSPRVCKSCRAPVCKKCMMKVEVLATPCDVRVECCKVCVVTSKGVCLDPREQFPLITLNEEERREL